MLGLATGAVRAQASTPASSKLVVIPFENQSYDDIIASSQAPYLNTLISQGTLFTHYTAVADGSNPNYLAMTSGLTAAVTPPSPNVFQALDAGGISWKELMESMTGTCGAGSAGNVPGSTDPLYSSDHDPVVSGYQGNTTCSTNDIPLTASSLNSTNLPSFTYLVPNECDDMHTAIATNQSCPAYFGPTSGSSEINIGDNWLSKVVPSLLAQSNVTVLITWDEWNSETGTTPLEHIVTLEVGAGVTAGGFDNNSYTHYSLEAGLYRYLGLGTAPNNGATALALPIPASGAPPYPGQSNPITKENSQPGTTSWLLNGNVTVDEVNQQVEGYASATSVNVGSPITFYVSVNPKQTYTIDIYRFGYYQGLGGRFMMEVANLNGVTQPSCPMDSATGMIACNWAASYTLNVPTTWVSGVFLAKLTNAQGYQNYIIFVVRNDSDHSALLYQLPFNTYQAYNAWPNDIPAGGTYPVTGKDLYDPDSSTTLTGLGTQRAVEVSYDRPYAENSGAGPFLNWDANDVAWLEQQGYDVSYTTSVDTDLSPPSVLNHKAVISGAHDEYWSMTMFNNVSAARNSGVNLAFLGADSVSWQIRYAPNAAGVPDREIICYKSATLDPVQNNTITVHFDDPQVDVPEQALVGGVHGGQQLGSSSATPVPFIVENSSNWVYTNTGASNGESIPNVVGYEIQSYDSVFPSPTSAPGTYQLLSNSPVINSNNAQVYQNASIYQAGSGAWVFSAASIEWGWSLFDFGFSIGGDDHPDYANSFIQIMTANVLNKFSAGTLPLPAAPTNLRAVPSTSSVSLTWTDNDATATYEIDRSTDAGFSTFTTVSLPAGTTNYDDTGLSSDVYYYRLFAIDANGESPYVPVNAATISYAALVAGRSGLLAHWRLGDASGTTAYDTTGTYNGTYVNTPTLGVPGAITNDSNTSVTFNGTSQRVTLPSFPSIGDFSIEGWTHLTNASVNNNTLYGGSGTVRLLARPGTAGYPTAAYAGVTLNGTEYYLQPPSPASNIDTWVDWVLTRQGSALTLYRDGIQIAQRTDLPATATAIINGYIASQSNSVYYLAGGVQDVALYTQALTSDQVSDAYVAALNGVAPSAFPVTPAGFAAHPGASAVTLSWIDGDTSSSYLLYRSTTTSFATPITISLPPGTSSYTDTALGQGVFYYRLVATSPIGQSSYVYANAATISYAALVAGRNGLLAHWRLGENSGTTAWDTTGTYNGFYVGGPTLGSPGAITSDPNTSVTYNGSSQRVTLPSLPSVGDFSVEGWTYLTNGSVNNNTLFGGSSVQLLPRPGNSTYPTAAYAAVTLNGTLYALQPTSPASNINTWVYWVLTRQGGTLTLYRDGSPIAQRTDLPSTATTSLSGYIADQSNGAYYLTGRVQDVALYNQALTGQDVANGFTAGLNGLAPTPPAPPGTPYYNAVRSESTLRAYWRLGESRGTTAFDATGTYNGTYVNGPNLGSPGAIVNDPDTAATFNGSNQRVTLPTLPSVGDFSIEGWTYLTNASVNNNTLFGSASAVQLLARPGTGSYPTAAYAGVTLGVTQYVLQPNSPASDMNTWVYWVLTRQGGTLTLYRDAVPI
ncbi:MAG TPA: N,N-dimethylformamidase beta subunit family domain-containing protein, partial [Candidatus Acidoferrum sp.]|nr:N,N-dimethylformamidase beta subunit family domain-containing protein [Candidatus Acidoferrum sp.]